MTTARHKLNQCKRIVVKFGSSLLSSNEIFGQIAGQLSDLEKKGYEFVIVSSGAIAAGKDCLKNNGKRPLTIPEKQAAAAIGQSRLIKQYENAFAKHEKTIAQILLTHEDMADRTRYLNARHTLLTLLQNKVLPVINENDSVGIDEIKFGDNDNLSAIITNLVSADLLLLMTDQEGLYDDNPNLNPKAKFIEEVKVIDQTIFDAASSKTNEHGIGGMTTKIEAAKKAGDFGVPTVIAHGGKKDTIKEIVSGKKIGTLFLPSQDQLKSRKHWIAHVLKKCGSIIVDEGAYDALVNKQKSLLPSGVLAIEGKFAIGDAVGLSCKKKGHFAQGLINYNHEELQKIMGKKTQEIEEILGYKYYDEVIHRDDLVIL